MATTQINLRLNDELLAKVDAARGDVPRNRWLVIAVEAYLAGGDMPPGSFGDFPVVRAVEQATGRLGNGGHADGIAAPAPPRTSPPVAPAEQPLNRADMFRQRKEK